jgi:hypothetical protein
MREEPVQIGADGTDVDAVPAVLAFAAARDLPHLRRPTAQGGADGIGPLDLFTDPHAALTVHTAPQIPLDQRVFIDGGQVLAGKIVAMPDVGKEIGQVLKITPGRLVAVEAVQRMLGELQLQRRLAGLVDLFALGLHHHAVLSRRGAGRLKFRNPLDRDQTHAAAAQGRELLQITETGDTHADAVGRLDD